MTIRFLLAPAIFIFSVLILKVSSVQANGQVQLHKTGQFISSAAGDDGALQMGMAWPVPRFADNSVADPQNLTVTDALTRLTWAKDGNAPGPEACGPAVAKNWQGALDYVTCLNGNNYLGRTDWRLPNSIELSSLLNYGQASPADWLNTRGFFNVQADCYWSSGSDARYTGYAWYISMKNGILGYGNKVNNSYHVWPVRGGQWTLDLLNIYGVFNFGSRNVGLPVPHKEITLYNAGISPQPVTAINITGANANQFSITPGGANPCTSLTPALAAGSKCTLNLGYAPSSAGFKTATLAIASNGNVLHIPVTGTGVLQYFNLKLLFAGDGNGQVSGDMACIAGSDCPPKLFQQGTTATLLATPDVNSIFGGWSNACATSGINCSVAIDAPKTATATFIAAPNAKIGSTLYATLTSAFAAAGNGTIKARAIEFSESPTVTLPTVMEGGYNAAFGSTTGYSIINGILTIAAGSLTVEWLTIK